MKTTTSALPVTSSSRMNTIGSPFFVVSCLIAPTMPPTVTTSPSRRRSSSASAQSVLRRSWSRIACERVLADVEAERLLLQPQELVLLELARAAIGGWCAARSSSAVAEVEDRALAGEPVGLRRAGRSESACSSASSIPCRERARRVERAALDERLERALVHHLRVDPLGEVPERLERPPSSRAATIARAAESPTFLTAFRPKRILPSTTAKSHCGARSRRAAAPRSPSRGTR